MVFAEMTAVDVPSSPYSVSNWPRWLPLAIGFVAIVVAHFPLLTYDPGVGRLEGIENALFETTSASPQLVLAIWSWFVYARWPRLRGFEGQQSPFAGIVLLILGASLCVWAHYVATPALLVVSLSLISLASGLFLGGFAALRTLLFPAVFLLLAMPVPTPVVNFIMYPMQIANAKAVEFVLSTIGFVPAVSGELIFVGEKIFQVIESCSGLRTTLTIVMSAFVYTEFTWHNRGRTIALIALSPLIGLLANHLRILTIIFNPYSSIASVHAAQGLLMVVFAVVLLAVLDSFLARVWKTPAEPHLVVEAPTGRLPRAVSGSFAAICISVAVASSIVPRWSAPEERSLPLVRIKANLADWNLTGFKPNQEFLGTVRYDEFVAHRYQRGNEPSVKLFVASNRRLDPSLGLGSAKTIIPGPGGVRISSSGDLDAPNSNIEAAIVQMPMGPRLVYHWKVGFRSLWEETARAILALDRSPFRRPGRSAFVRLSTPIAPGMDGLADATDRLGVLTDALRADFVEVGVWPAPER